MDTTGYIIITVYFAVLIVIGIFCSRKQDSLSDFFLAGKNIPAWAALAAVVATETSALTFIGVPAIAFAEGGDFSFLQLALGYIAARFILAYFFLPKFFQREIVTIYEFLGHHFGQSVQRVSGIFFFITRVLAAGVRHYVAALVIVTFTDTNLIFAIILTGAISFVYSLLGGIAAVIWTEVFQLIVMISGAVLAFVYLIHLIPGGLEGAVQLANENQKFTFVHWDWGETGAYTFFAGLLGGFFLNLASHGADQDLVQRLLSCRNLRGAQTAIIGSGFFVFLQFAFFLFIGVLLFAYYGTLPADVDKADQLLPYFVVQELPSAAAAIVIAAILSAALSSTASALNSLSSTAVTDFVIPYRKTPLDSKTLVTISRGFTLFWTVMLIIIAFFAQRSESILDTGLKIPSLTYGSLLAVFLLGIFTKFRHPSSLIAGMILGTVTVLCVTLTSLSWTWYVTIGTISTIAYAYLFQFVWRKIKT